MLWGKAILSLLLLALTLHIIGAQNMWQLLSKAAWRPLAGGALILVVSGFTGMAAWRSLLAPHTPTLPLSRMLAAHWSGMFFNSFLPSNIGGDLVRGALVANHGPGLSLTAASLIADRLLGLYALTLIGACAVAIDAAGITAGGAVAVGGLALLAALPHLARRKWLPATADTQPLSTRQIFIRDMALVATSPHALAKASLFGFITQALRIWPTYFVIQALALDIPGQAIWKIIPFFGVVSAIPLSIGGLGLREYLAQKIAVDIGFDALHLTALSLGGHALMVATNTLGAFPFMLYRRARRAAGA